MSIAIQIAPHRVFHRLHGTPLEITAENSRHLEVVGEILRYYGAEPVGGDGPEGESMAARLILRAAEEGPAAPSDARLEGNFGGVRVWELEGRVWIEAPGLTFVAEPEAGRAEGFLTPGVWTLGRALGQGEIVPFVLALMILLRRQRLFAMHGAAVSYQGRGCLFLGAGGSGKSTQALGMVVAGWSHLSDDSLLVDASSGDVEVLALRRHFYLTPAAAAPFPEQAAAWQDCPLTGGPKRRLDMGRAFPGQVAAGCRPQWLIFPRIVDTAESRVEPMAKSEALHQLLHQSNLVTLEPKLASNHLDALKRLLEQTRAFVLRAGRDLKEAPWRVEKVLRPLTSNSTGGS